MGAPELAAATHQSALFKRLPWLTVLVKMAVELVFSVFAFSISFLRVPVTHPCRCFVGFPSSLEVPELLSLDSTCYQVFSKLIFTPLNK